MYSYLRIQHCASQPKHQQSHCWSLTQAFLVVYGLRWLEIIRIFKQGTVAQYCFWMAHCINITLFCCCRFTLWMYYCKKTTNSREDLVGCITTSGNDNDNEWQWKNIYCQVTQVHLSVHNKLYANQITNIQHNLLLQCLFTWQRGLEALAYVPQ